MLVFEILAIEILAGKCSLLIFHSIIIDQLKFSKTIKKKDFIRLLQMAYNYTCKRFIKKMGVHGQKFLRHSKWIKPEDFENLTKNSKT